MCFPASHPVHSEISVNFATKNEQKSWVSVLFSLAFAMGGYSASGDTGMKQENTRSAEQNKALIRQVIKLVDERNLDEAFELYALSFTH